MSREKSEKNGKKLITAREIANELGTTRTTVNRIIKKLAIKSVGIDQSTHAYLYSYDVLDLVKKNHKPASVKPTDVAKAEYIKSLREQITQLKNDNEQLIYTNQQLVHTISTAQRTIENQQNQIKELSLSDKSNEKHGFWWNLFH